MSGFQAAHPVETCVKLEDSSKPQSKMLWKFENTDFVFINIAYAVSLCKKISLSNVQFLSILPRSSRF